MGEQDRLQKMKKIVEDSDAILDKLNIMAADDGIISNDEVDLINVINAKMKEYKSLLQSVLEDNVVDDDELEKMRYLENEIVEIVERQAMEDGKVSVPEQELMDTLFSCLNTFKTL